MVLLSSGAFIGPEMVLGYFISNNKSRYGFRLFYILFATFVQKGAQNPFGKSAAHYRKKCPIISTYEADSIIDGLTDKVE